MGVGGERGKVWYRKDIFSFRVMKSILFPLTCHHHLQSDLQPCVTRFFFFSFFFFFLLPPSSFPSFPRPPPHSLTSSHHFRPICGQNTFRGVKFFSFFFFYCMLPKLTVVAGTDARPNMPPIRCSNLPHFLCLETPHLDQTFHKFAHQCAPVKTKIKIYDVC